MATGPDGGIGSGSGSGSGAVTCDPHVAHLTSGSSLTLDSNTSGANPQRDYCVDVPSGVTELHVDLMGGTCGQFNCTGDDVKMVLERGAVPDAYLPDASATTWTYTPDPTGYGNYVKGTQSGAWYLTIIDGQYTLGYTGVSLKLSLH